jgi:anti-sigma regulatory factor (Ser/Thr protein kinase)
MKTKINATPSTNLIRSWREDTRITLEMVVNELVDNAFDWGAKRVEITFYKQSLRVKDDGIGIQDIEKALTFGESADGPFQRLGRFGIALKKGPSRLGEQLYIKSSNHKEHIELFVYWRLWERSNDWSLEPDITPNASGNTGTEVWIKRFYPHRVRHWADLHQKLARTFAPALQSGREIIWQADGTNPLSLVYTPTAGLEDQIECDGVTAGLQFHLLAGIMPEGKRANQGFSLAYGHRVIVEKWTPKFLADCKTTRFHGEILLKDSTRGLWSLNNFKDDIEEEQKELLADAIEQLLQRLIEKLKDESLHLRIHTIETHFENFLNSGTAKAWQLDKDGQLVDHPEPNQGKGGKRQKKRPKKEIDATPDKGSPDKKSGPSAITFKIKFEPDDSADLWRIEHCADIADTIITFIVNLHHPVGPQLREEAGSLRLIDVVTMGLCSYLTTRSEYQKRFPFLLNGTFDPHEAMKMNASRWLRHAALV